ncbi:MAG: SDR family oxidoreductase [Akkermansiaceae bacterium]|nr:SDR family oxidoreductase [Akkermansiaceae bacterium]
MLAIDLSDKRALVTGASDGVGAGVATALAKAGCHVVGTGRVEPDHPRAQKFIDTVASHGRHAHYLSGDLSRAETPALFVQQAAGLLGGLDIVVSNAGLNVFKGTEHCSEEDWSYNMELNLASHWRLGKAALPFLRDSKGVFQVMNSNHAYSTIKGCFPYQTTKAALLGLVQSAAIEWGPDVRVVGIAPGFIDTPGNQVWFDQFPDPAAERKRTEELHPTKSIGQADEVGALSAFLASSYAQFITGNTILMDGGRSAIMQDI